MAKDNSYALVTISLFSKESKGLRFGYVRCELKLGHLSFLPLCFFSATSIIIVSRCVAEVLFILIQQTF